jgi:hypothetical protein
MIMYQYGRHLTIMYQVNYTLEKITSDTWSNDCFKSKMCLSQQNK